jgi:hypothetical protein
MTSIVYFDPEDGRILKVLVGQDDVIEANKPSETAQYISGPEADSTEQYVLEGALVDRPLMSLSPPPETLQVDVEMVITGLPTGSEVHHQGGVAVIDDGSLEWSSDLPGVYSFMVVKFPYQEEVFHVTVTL